MGMLTMVGLGAALATGQPLPCIQTNATINIMLGGKAMQRMKRMSAGD